MAHYAFMDLNNVVVKVIVGVDETVTQDDNGVEVGGSTEAWETFYTTQLGNANLFVKRCSYNANIRNKYPALGDIWNGTDFVAPNEPVEL